MRSNDGFFSRMFRMIIAMALIAGVGSIAYNSMGGKDGLNDFINSSGDISQTDGQGDSGGKLDGLNDKLDKAAGINTPKLRKEFGEPGDDAKRPYKDYSNKAMDVLKDNVSAPSKKMGYDREEFFIHNGGGWNKIKEEGSQNAGWKDFKDKNCTVRQAVLVEQGSNVTHGKGCSKMKGTWVDKYGERVGGKVKYHKSTVAKDFDIDHVVALSLAWRSHMGSASKDLRNMLANDKGNLLVSDKSLNRSKGDQSFDEWTPPLDSENYCDYYDRYVYIKAKYNLTVTSSEFDKLNKAKEKCGV